MMAMVGSESSFEQGREQLALLAGIEVTSKAVERQAEMIGGDIEACQQAEVGRAKQLELPELCTPAVPILYIEMDGTGRAGGEGGTPSTRGVKWSSERRGQTPVFDPRQVYWLGRGTLLNLARPR